MKTTILSLLSMLSACAATPKPCAPAAAGAQPCSCSPAGARLQGVAAVGEAVALPSQPLPTTSSDPVELGKLVGAAPYTVITFFSVSCPCQSAHDERLRQLWSEFAPRGVAFVAVDSEASSGLELDRRESAARKLPFTIASDPDGLVADAVGAQYATETLVVDRERRVHFHGGLDSDQQTLRGNARLWLRDALAALLAGREPETPSPKAFGCALRRR